MALNEIGLLSKEMIWGQFGTAIDMLENAINACPQEIWGNKIDHHQFWYLSFHTLFFLDLYSSESEVGFAPPQPFTLDEMDERGLLPEVIYTKEELLDYLHYGRKKCYERIFSLSEEEAIKKSGVSWLDLSNAEVLLYNMRHVQHHVAQLNSRISAELGLAPRWVKKTIRNN